MTRIWHLLDNYNIKMKSNLFH
ncbi:hypothetical protein [Bacillus sp. SA1-12]